MDPEVVVKRRGRTTIPAEIRKKRGIQEGTRLKVETEDEKVVMTKVPSILDLAGTSRLTTKEAFKLLDAMREEQ